MATPFKLLVILVSFLSGVSSGSSNKLSKGDINRWCNTTPHPGPCKYYVKNHHHPFKPPKGKSDFGRIMVKIALERAKRAKSQAKKIKHHCENKRQKRAWKDCYKLYDNTIIQLTRAYSGLKSNHSTCTNFDAQTWLSAALTNIQTCKTGSVELNVTEFISPLLSNNVTELLSNSLALNNGCLANGTDDSSKGFPSWLTENERRLLLSTSVKANLVVAKDGSGNYRSVQTAINAAAAAKRSGIIRFIIRIKRGVYKENIEVGNNVKNIMLIGDGITKTVITGSRSVGGGSTTYNSATAGINGPQFMARDITFTNTAGPLKGQAVALRSGSDLSVFYRCAIVGYQDTLMVHSQRQFYRECFIYGTIDFIFGNAAVVFQQSTIYVRKPIHGQVNVITAQARDDPNQNTGISIHNSRILAAPDLQPLVSSVKTYLGRPWRQYSRTVIMKTYLDTLVHPTGWLRWGDTNFALNTLYYGEYKNTGPRATTRWRVRWNGFHVITSANVATRFTAGSFIAGRSWLPSAGVPYTSGL